MRRLCMDAMLRVHREALQKSSFLEKGWGRALDNLQTVKNKCEDMCSRKAEGSNDSASPFGETCAARDIRELVSWIQATVNVNEDTIQQSIYGRSEARTKHCIYSLTTSKILLGVLVTQRCTILILNYYYFIFLFSFFSTGGPAVGAWMG